MRLRHAARFTLLWLFAGPVTGRLVTLGRAGLATSAMALGFLAVFGSFGLLTVSVASIVQRYLPYVTLLIGCVLIALGGWLLSGREVGDRVDGQELHWAPTARLWSMTGYGVGYALASLSCTIGPFLAVTGSSVGTGSALGAMSVYLAYAAGFVLVVGAWQARSPWRVRPWSTGCGQYFLRQPSGRADHGGGRSLRRLLRVVRVAAVRFGGRCQ